MNKNNEMLSVESFPGFSGIDIGRLLYIRTHKKDKRFLNFKQRLYIALSGIVQRSHIRWMRRNGNSNLYLSDKRVIKKNYQIIDDKIVSLNCGVDVIELYYKNTISIDLSIYHLIKEWKKIFKRLSVPIYLQRLMIYDLTDLYSIKREISENELKTYLTMIVLFDGRIADNFFIQMANNAGLNTATLQHGHYFYPRNDKGLYSGTPLNNLTAQYLLAWCNYTKSEARLAGVDENRVVVCGNPELIDLGEVRQPSEEKYFVVYLDADQLQDRNTEIIKLCYSIAVERGWKMKVKFHPTSSMEKYADVMHPDIAIIDKMKSNADVLKSAPFIVSTGSSIIIMAAGMKVPILRYEKENDEIEDCYPGVSFLTFRDFETGINLFEMIDNNDEKINANVKHLFERFGICGSIRKNYEDFFTTFKGRFSNSN